MVHLPSPLVSPIDHVDTSLPDTPPAIFVAGHLETHFAARVSIPPKTTAAPRTKLWVDPFLMPSIETATVLLALLVGCRRMAGVAMALAPCQQRGHLPQA